LEETKMKKNYFLAIAVAALMLAATVAQAADISFSGQFRPRYNVNSDSTDTTDSYHNFDTRVRLNANAKVNANTEVNIQFQSVGTWGDPNNAAGSRISATGSDILADVGLHQATLTLRNLMGQAVDAKIGRQEVVFDGHRLFGHTGWTQGAQTNDAIKLTHAAGNHTVNYVYIEARNDEALNALDSSDESIHAFRVATQGVLGGALQGYFVIVDDESTTAIQMDDVNTFYTIGARQAGKLGGLDYRVEYYHQFGDGGAAAVAGDFDAAYNTMPNNSSDHDRDASMFGIRVGKTFKNAKFSPTVTLWFDSLSGTDDDDVTGDDYGSFNTIQDTGHKFYGLMDNLGAVGAGGLGYFGLEDYAIKLKLKLSDKNTLKADFHHFETQTDISGSDADTIVAQTTVATLGANAMDPDLGQEIDMTLVHKYDANTKFIVGYSHYFTTTTLSQLQGQGGTSGSNSNDDQDWMFVMVDTKF
jgi:hypothetical protein